jgi:cell shape-determining protein MreC
LPAYVNEPAENGGRRHWVVAVVFVVLALVLLYLPPVQQQRIATVLRATVLRPFVLTQEALTAARLRATESERLRAVLDSVVGASTPNTVLLEENQRLRGLLSLSVRLGPSWVAASVIRAGTVGSESTFQLDVGSADGVEVNAPVITRAGLMGLVREVGQRTALGMDWTHPEFRASAMSQDGLTTGMVETVRGDFREEDRLQFNGTAFHTSLADGTMVVTTGLGVIPRGIPVGTIAGLAEEDEGWRRSYWLDPMVEPRSVTHVLVATELRGVPDVSSGWSVDSASVDTDDGGEGVSGIDGARIPGDSAGVLPDGERGAVADSVSGGGDPGP